MRRIQSIVYGSPSALLALALVFGAAAPVTAGRPSEPKVTNARLRDPLARMAVAQAIRSARRQLREPECQQLLVEFADAAGRPLRDVVAAEGMEAPEYLDRVLFYDAPAESCLQGKFAFTAAGSRAVFICGRKFGRAMQENSRHAEATIIHEMLHSLGLGENPPSSAYITTRVRARCGP